MELDIRTMEGRIYISGAFRAIKRSSCGQKGWLDNDPHFWTSPPTWGICRTDFRNTVQKGDYIFFVLPKSSDLPQMVYAYLKVREKITHLEAYRLSELRSKRMGNKNPNGNIIVDANGYYNRFDGGVHRDRFEEIIKYYIIGDEIDSESLDESRIRTLALEFKTVLNELWRTRESTVFEVVGRKGRKMSAEQVKTLLTWLRH